jgi:hypothetical protein
MPAKKKAVKVTVPQGSCGVNAVYPVGTTRRQGTPTHYVWIVVRPDGTQETGQATTAEAAWDTCRALLHDARVQAGIIDPAGAEAA